MTLHFPTARHETILTRTEYLPGTFRILVAVMSKDTGNLTDAYELTNLTYEQSARIIEQHYHDQKIRLRLEAKPKASTKYGKPLNPRCRPYTNVNQTLLDQLSR